MHFLFNAFKSSAVKFLLATHNSAGELLGKFLTHDEKMKHYWNASALKLARKKREYSSPLMPSPGDAAECRAILEKSGAEKVLVLGSTPEYRDLLAKMGVKNYVVADFSMSMIENSLAFCKKADADNEIWLKADWISLPARNNYFDAIIGDLVMAQLLPEDQPRFLQRMFDLLKAGGSFIVRAHIMNEKNLSIDVKEIIASMLDYLVGNENSAAVRTLLFFRLRDRLRDEKRQITDPARILNAVDVYQPRNEQEERFLAKFRRFLEYRSKRKMVFTTQSESETEKIFRRFFEIKEKRFVQDYEDAAFFPIYRLQKPVFGFLAKR
ncbi:MAG: class I SAM-dependent methyltransferase [Parcubacteria group bacterium]|nr:class I SAM-dependent methyltransferase [Parcubacteria group bacterium]